MGQPLVISTHYEAEIEGYFVHIISSSVVPTICDTYQVCDVHMECETIHCDGTIISDKAKHSGRWIVVICFLCDMYFMG